ncbi:haloacid dehalogenase-like hydrolase [Eggerthellaceae bacterium zg-1084]|uniref:Haloacid dehalogenase-like hydrolase n=1 Tax=Berryella wangjianweii TaxID=2734634 RepID=A0A6M8JBG8_9ACTN|nr:haloacid dehalogenase-like hydrolase [Berryella wangjianweii]NPD32930.1 haloacid dehalogenase-like hydrolase [Eggerthellaceae bacterium zg-997]QKF08062.1 haloacid dehalogenase-like hydrolase [Berryella wangjianweii]
MTECPGQRGRVQVAVFDFDGTSIEGSSPVLLVRRLARSSKLRPSVVARIALWGAAYKLRLPQSEAWVRGLVFTAFEGRPRDEVDAFLRAFYDDAIEPRFRPEAHAEMERLHREGCVVAMVSASFEPIILRAMELHPIDCQASTRMKVAADGTYTCQVEGECVEGEAKLTALTQLCDGLYGAGAWELAHAYGDHHSDRALLRAAREAHVVSPDRPLSRTARNERWRRLDW